MGMLTWYLGQSERRVLARGKDHNGRGTPSHFFKHVVAGQQFVSCDDLKVVSKSYKSNNKNGKVWKCC